jgi:4'-phosphopantetheinyl transferase
VDIWRINLPQPQNVVEALDSILSIEDRARAARYARPSDRAQYKVTHGALRILLGTIAGQNPRAVSFDVNKNGKPRIMDKENVPRFSLSHTRDMGLLAITPRVEVGVDVEFQRPDFPCLEIADRFFSVEESGRLRALSVEAQRGAFFAAWVRKEAWIKAQGESLESLHLLNVGMGQSLREGRWWGADHALGLPAIWLQDVDVATNYAGAVVLNKLDKPVTPLLRYLEWVPGSHYSGG